MAEAEDSLALPIFCCQLPPQSPLPQNMLMMKSSNKPGVNIPAISNTQGFEESVKKECKQYILIATVT
jgi:hypothetical protein